MNYKILLVCILVGLFVTPVFAVPANFTEWSVSGDSFVAHNDTHTIRKWNSTGNHTWLTDGNATSGTYLIVGGGGSGGSQIGGGGGDTLDASAGLLSVEIYPTRTLV